MNRRSFLGAVVGLIALPKPEPEMFSLDIETQFGAGFVISQEMYDDDIYAHAIHYAMPPERFKDLYLKPGTYALKVSDVKIVTRPNGMKVAEVALRPGRRTFPGTP